MDISATWEKAISFVLQMEGGYTLDPNDPGGETNFGISKKAFPNLDIKNLTVDQAKDIYVKEYWNKCSCDQLPPPYAISVFDCAVNQGVGKSIRLLQIALGVEVDGIMGTETVSACFSKGKYGLKHYLGKRLAEYARLMSDNPKLLVFAYNWSYRVVALADIVLQDSLSYQKEVV